MATRIQVDINTGAIVEVSITAEELQAIADQSSKTAAQIEAEITVAVQGRLDTWARTRNYDGVLSACTYAASTVPKFATEGQACVNLRDATWSATYTILAAVEAGTRAMPSSIDDIAADLPALEWPV